MILGVLPLLSLDRTGIGLFGAIALLAVRDPTLMDAAQAVHLPTIMLLFAFMVVWAQLRLSGFCARVTVRLAALPLAPVLIDACRHRSLQPLPYLLGLACAANIGSAATLIGNPASGYQATKT